MMFERAIHAPDLELKLRGFSERLHSLAASCDEMARIRGLEREEEANAWANDPAKANERPYAIRICGECNSGKSSLFNALLGLDLAPVDALPGTTRTSLTIQSASGKNACKPDDGAEAIINGGAEAHLKDAVARAASRADSAGSEMVVALPLPGWLADARLTDTPGIDFKRAKRAEWDAAESADLYFITTNLCAAPLSEFLLRACVVMPQNPFARRVFAATGADRLTRRELKKLHSYLREKLRGHFGTDQDIIFASLPPDGERRLFWPADGAPFELHAYLQKIRPEQAERREFARNVSNLYAESAKIAARLEAVLEKFRTQAAKDAAAGARLSAARDFLAKNEEIFCNALSEECAKFSSRLEKRLLAYKSAAGLQDFCARMAPQEFAAFEKEFNEKLLTRIRRAVGMIASQFADGDLLQKDSGFVRLNFSAPGLFPAMQGVKSDYNNWAASLLRHVGDVFPERMREGMRRELAKSVERLEKDALSAIKVNFSRARARLEKARKPLALEAGAGDQARIAKLAECAEKLRADLAKFMADLPEALNFADS